MSYSATVYNSCGFYTTTPADLPSEMTIGKKSAGVCWHPQNEQNSYHGRSMFTYYKYAHLVISYIYIYIYIYISCYSIYIPSGYLT